MGTTTVYISLSGLRLDCSACGASVEFKPPEARALFRYWMASHHQPRVAVLYAIGSRTPNWSGPPPDLVASP